MPVVFVGVLEEVTEIYEFCVFLEKNFDVIVTDGEINKIRVFRFVFFEVVNKNWPPSLIGLMIDYFKYTHSLTTGGADGETVELIHGSVDLSLSSFRLTERARGKLLNNLVV